MPETAALIKRHYVDWYAMHWGGGTLSHANTAGSLWRAGLRPFTVCSSEQHHRYVGSSSGRNSSSNISSAANLGGGSSSSSMSGAVGASSKRVRLGRLRGGLGRVRRIGGQELH
jgi:hypothetical protein